MKILNKDGERFFSVKSPDPKKIPNIEAWVPNQKECLFCQNCSIALDCRNPKHLKLQIGCKLPCVANAKSNCILHNNNRNHTCSAFKDVDEDGQVVYAMKKEREVEKKSEPVSFNLSKDGVEQINK